jgi:hypothetical protein
MIPGDKETRRQGDKEIGRRRGAERVVRGMSRQGRRDEK